MEKAPSTGVRGGVEGASNEEEGRVEGRMVRILVDDRIEGKVENAVSTRRTGGVIGGRYVADSILKFRARGYIQKVAKACINFEVGACEVDSRVW